MFNLSSKSDRDLLFKIVTENSKAGRVQWDIASKELNNAFVDNISPSGWRTRRDRAKVYREREGSELPGGNFGVNKSEADGLYNSQRYIELDVTKHYTPNEILMAHGFDPTLFELVNAGSTGSRIGTNANDQQYFINTYRRVTVKERVFKLTQETLIELLTEYVEPKEILPRPNQSHQGLFTIPLFDMHLGINTYEDYVESQSGIYRYIQSQYWDENLYIIGQDLFHNDDFRGRTTKGTPIEQVDINQAWHDALRFYCPLIEESLEHSQTVKVIYSRGNHDETLAWAFVQLLKHKYPNLVVDDDQREHKHHVYKGNFIGVTHGDKTQDNKLAQIFNSLFRVEMAQAATRIILRGHLHTNKMIDEYGTLIIGLGTKAKTDEWHLENGYVGNRKQFEVFIYDEEKLHAHIYI